jgi:hypothetical protein
MFLIRLSATAVYTTEVMGCLAGYQGIQLREVPNLKAMKRNPRGVIFALCMTFFAMTALVIYVNGRKEAADAR